MTGMASDDVRTSNLVVAESEDVITVNTEDAQNVVDNIDIIISSLCKAGVPRSELQHFKCVVKEATRTHPNIIPDDSLPHSEPGLIFEGPLSKLEQGYHGFAPIWKPRWTKILIGEIKFYSSKTRPDPHQRCAFSLPLSVQQTSLDIGNELLCSKLKKDCIFMVRSVDGVGGPVRCVTLATKDENSQNQWYSAIEKALSPNGKMLKASIFKACQLGDILRVKELIAEGTPINCTNLYGCVPLHYAARNAAEYAVLVAKGGMEEAGVESKQLQAQEALRIVVYLMSHGADAYIVNDIGEDPLSLAARCTAEFPRARKLLVSILDSSRYKADKGALYIEPGNTCLPSLEEEGGVGGLAPAPPTTISVRGVVYSPSRQRCRQGTEQRGPGDCEAENRPLRNLSSAQYSQKRSIVGWRAPNLLNSPSVAPLPVGDHENILGGPQHRLATALTSKGNSLERKCHRLPDLLGTQNTGGQCDKKSHRCLGGRLPSHEGNYRNGVSRVERGVRKVPISVFFKEYRLGRNSSVPTKCLGRQMVKSFRGRRPKSCPEQLSPEGGGGRSQSERGRLGRLGAKKGLHPKSSPLNQSIKQRTQAKTSATKSESQRNQKHEQNVPSVSDMEARAMISSWIRENAKLVSIPKMESFTEGSPHVSFGSRAEIYQALRTIKGDGWGELIPAQNLRTALCTVGQPLETSEMDGLLESGDPAKTGYISCSKVSDILSGERLRPLKDGVAFYEDDDVVSKMKRRRQEREEAVSRATPTVTNGVNL